MTRATSSVPPAVAAGRPGGRVALWDNARLGLMVLVVFGHSIETLRSGSPLTTAIYDVVYAFHMPAFLLVSGWFARADRLDAKSLVGTAKLLVTWLLAEAGWVGIRALTGDDPFPADFLVLPSWTLWFLVALVSMRILLPYLAQLRFPLITVTAVSLAVGLSPVVGTQFSASRTLAMLPFFVLGWRLRQLGVGERAWFLRPTTGVRIGAGAALAVLAGVVLLLTRLPVFTNQLLFYRRGYPGMDIADPLGVLLRLTFLTIGAAMTVAVLVLIPRREFRFSSLGANTMAVYLLHTPLIEAFRRLRVDDVIAGLPLSLVLLVLLSAAVTLLLASTPVARIMRPVTDPRWPFRSPKPV
ncbi:acyltransferase family protein [uncultured Amnibacterium sp.]|uniref:acyltransferase family protein n=1 Tax=uncultured Amnibacterium sp. TaxID=1631851 RepID=UPI0035CB7CA3